MRTPNTALVPPRRLGSLLRQARVAGGLELDDLARLGDLGVGELEDIEQGRASVDDSMLQSLLSLYGVQDAELLPERSVLVIDLDEDRIAIDQADLTIGDVADADAVLTRYLALVYRLRNLPLGSPIQLREVDLDVLSTALSITSTDVESRITTLIADKPAVGRDQRRLRKRLLVPLAGVVVAATAVGVLVLVADGNTDPAPVITDSPSTAVPTDLGPGSAVVDNPAAVVETDIGNGGAVEINPANP